jgi:hypothetical protein
MSDIFISYSRRDSEFVKRLHAGLVAQKRDVWVDFEDIPLSADWWEEISNNIESADTFIFVISPDSLGSPICNFELAHAAQLNKRLIPIVRVLGDEKTMYDTLSKRELDENMKKTLAQRNIGDVARQNWQAISRHNWLFFADDSQFDDTFRKLIVVIDTDLEHVRQHTRLLVKAKEWETRGKTPNFLLNSGEISEYSAWVRASASKDPKPTELQLEYLFVSQRAANRRQAMLSIGVMIGLVVTGILIAFAYVQNQRIQEGEQTQVAIANEALAQRATSDAQAIILTEQRVTVEANQVVLTAQVATNIARQTSVAQDQTDKIATAQAGFISLTQQSDTIATATAINATLESLSSQNTQVVSTLNAFQVLATQLFFPTANPTLVFEQVSTQVIANFLTQENMIFENGGDAFTSTPVGWMPTATPQGWSGTAVALAPTSTSSPAPTLTPTPTPTPTALPTETPLPPEPTRMALEPRGDNFFFVETTKGNDNNDCKTERSACQTISGALQKAPDTAVINISYGIYNEALTITQDVVLQGADRDLTILSGANNQSIVTVAESGRLRMMNMTVSGGVSSELGGGILNRGKLITQNVTITGNTATGNGGGIANFGRAVLLNTLVENNFGANGGGVYNGYGALYFSDSQTTNANNTASVGANGNEVYTEPCAPIVQEAFTQAMQVCQNVGLGQACYASPRAQAIPAIGANVSMLNVGDVINLTDVSSFNMDLYGGQSRSSILLNTALVDANNNQPTNYLLLGSDAVPLSNEPLRTGIQVVADTGFDSPLNIRSQPTVSSSIVTAVFTGVVMTTIDGPVNADGYTWWKVRLPNSAEGWAVDTAGTYRTLEAIETIGEIGLGGTYTVFGGGTRGLNLREAPNVNSPQITTILQGRDVIIIDGPIEADGYVWWQVVTTFSNEIGWVVDYADDTTTLIPVVRTRLGLPQIYYFNESVCNTVVQNPLKILNGSSVQRIGLVSDWE